MKKNLFIIPMTFLTIGTITSCGNSTTIADLVVYNNIFTAEDNSSSVKEAFAVKDGKYICVGKKNDVKKYIKEGTTIVIDGKNEGLVIPGATEGHGHYFSGVGLNSQLPGSDENYEKVKQTLEKEVKNGIKQFVSFGWNSIELNERKAKGDNFAKEIEAIAPNIPVVLIDNSGHGAICNETALKKARIDKNTTIRGGSIALDKDGEPSGYIADQVVYYVIEKAITRPLSDEKYKSACEYGQNQLLKYGYTNTLDAFSNMYDPTGLYEALKKLDESGELKLNVAECYNIRSYDSEIYKDRVNEVADIVKNYSSKHLHPEFIKIFADGVVEAGTGWMIEPYKNGTYGNAIFTQPELDAITTYANSNGLLIHGHAYGDAANKAMINSYIVSNSINKNQYRNCLAHVRNIKTDDIQRAADNKISIAANLIWHTDYPEGDPSKQLIIDNIGEERYYNGYPMKSLIDKGVNVSSSTDAPAAVTIPGSILNVLEISVTGIQPGEDIKPFAPGELLSVEQGLKALTINGAWQLGIEKERGSIKEGKYADFVIIDKNILNYQGEELRKIHEAKILNTYFEGKEAYKYEPANS